MIIPDMIIEQQWILQKLVYPSDLDLTWNLASLEFPSYIVHRVFVTRSKMFFIYRKSGQVERKRNAYEKKKESAAVYTIQGKASDLLRRRCSINHGGKKSSSRRRGKSSNTIWHRSLRKNGLGYSESYQNISGSRWFQTTEVRMNYWTTGWKVARFQHLFPNPSWFDSREEHVRSPKPCFIIPRVTAL